MPRLSNGIIIILSNGLIIIFLRPLAQSRRLKIKQYYGWIWLSLRFERARKRDCIFLLDGNGKTLKEVNDLEWITHLLLLLLLLDLSLLLLSFLR